MNIDGEDVCRKCGTVLGYSEVQSINDYKSHSVGLFGNHSNYFLIQKISKNLFLPSYATQTILQVTSKLIGQKITKKYSILFATVYACRIHNIPRLLEDIFFELEKSFGRKIRRSEKSLLKLLNKISKNIEDSTLVVRSPNKDYYLKAYLTKIQALVVKETDEKYFELMRVRSLRQIESLKMDPSTAAKSAIMKSTSSIMRTKLREVLS